MYHNFLIHSSANGHLDCSHVQAIVNSAAIAVCGMWMDIGGGGGGNIWAQTWRRKGDELCRYLGVHVPCGTVSAKALRQAAAYLECLQNHQTVRLVWREEGKQVGNEAGEVTRGCSKEFHSYSEWEEKPVLAFELMCRRDNFSRITLVVDGNYPLQESGWSRKNL